MPSGPQIPVPGTIPDSCTTDDTSALNAFFASLPPSAVVLFPDLGCYLVSNSASSLLLIAKTTGVTIEGNGSMFKQTTYETATGTNACGNLITDPILTLNANTDLAIDNLVLDGPNVAGSPYACGGDMSEGDAGILVGGPADPVGNHGVTMTGVTVENIDGDGIELYPQLATNLGVNTNIVFQDGVLSNWGWFGVVGEGVSGFTFAHNSVNGGGFMDVEVDNNCFIDCLNPDGSLRGDGVDNMTISHNTFQVGGFILSEGPEGCIPENNWVVSGNDFGTGSAGVALDGSYGNPNCPTDNTGFTYSDNTGGISGSSCGGSYATPPGNCAAIGLTAWADVTITDNSVGFPAGVLGTRQDLGDAALSTTGGVTTLTSPSVELVPSDVGDLVVAQGVQLGDKIATVTSAHSATLSQPATTDSSSTPVAIGQGSYFADTPVMQAVGLCGVAGAVLKDNVMVNAYSLWAPSRCFDATNSTLPTTDVVACGNTWGLTDPQPYFAGTSLTPTAAPATDPITDATCS